MIRLLARCRVISMPFYAVHLGRTPGVYTTWSDCENQVKGFTGARYKKYDTEEEALAFVKYGAKKAVEEACSKKGSTSTDVCSEPTASHSSSSDKGSKSVNNTATSASSSGASKTGKRSAILLSQDEVSAKKPKTGDSVEVFTDGCCHFNGKGGSQAGIGVYWGPGHPNNLSERLPGRQTNNRAEIYAVMRAVQQAKAADIKELVIHTDSQFVINCQTKWVSKWKKNGWKSSTGEEVVNREELELLDAELADLKVTYVHVKGHSGIEGNEAADKLANAGAKKQPDQTD